MRGDSCGECTHYAEALRYEAERWRANNLPDGHFIAEINPEYEPAMTNRLVVEQMEEGHPMEGVGFKSIEYSREKLEREKR